MVTTLAMAMTSRLVSIMPTVSTVPVPTVMVMLVVLEQRTEGDEGG